MTRSCLIVSPYFPPSTLAGVHRARLLAKHLPAAGWTPIVLCVDEFFYEEPLDPGLAALVPAALEIVKVRALDQRLCRPFGFGEVSLRAWWPLRQALFDLLAARDVDAVLITGSPFYPMLLTAEIKRRFGVSVILDFQDPWVSVWGASQPLFSKSGISHRLATALEPKAVRAADFITSVSEEQNAQLAARSPWMDSSRMAAVPIGGDPEDYEALSESSTAAIARAIDPKRVNISYVGTVWPPVLETLKALLLGARRLKDSAPELYSHLRLNFIGTSARQGATNAYQVISLARDLGVADVVHEIPERLPYLDALAIQAASHGILMLGSCEPHYTASKIYGVLMSGRPYMSIFMDQSSSHSILSQAGGGVALGFRDKEALTELPPQIAEGLKQLVRAPHSLGVPNSVAYAPYTAAAVARRFAAIFECIATRRVAAISRFQ